MQHRFFNSTPPLYSVSESDSLPEGQLERQLENRPQIQSEAEAAVARERERRERSKPIPFNLSEYLNEDQTLTLRQMESFGWQLAFIRRPLFQEPLVVVANADQTKFGVLEKDGSINMNAMFDLRH